MCMKKIFAGILAGMMACFVMVGCGAKGGTTNSSSEVAGSEAAVMSASEDLTAFPADCKLSDDEMRAVVTAYADYMTQALQSDGYVVEARIEDDGSVHYDGTRTDADGNTDTIMDLTSYDSVKDAFAYLYNCGQVDLGGNLLVGVSEGVGEAVDEALDEAASKAEEELVAVESAAESVESDDSAYETASETADDIEAASEVVHEATSAAE